jgi:hypothetical protein
MTFMSISVNFINSIIFFLYNEFSDKVKWTHACNIFGPNNPPKLTNVRDENPILGSQIQESSRVN